jgi:hypothetical protein
MSKQIKPGWLPADAYPTVKGWAVKTASGAEEVLMAVRGLSIEKDAPKSVVVAPEPIVELTEVIEAPDVPVLVDEPVPFVAPAPFVSPFAKKKG